MDSMLRRKHKVSCIDATTTKNPPENDREKKKIQHQQDRTGNMICSPLSMNAADDVVARAPAGTGAVPPSLPGPMHCRDPSNGTVSTSTASNSTIATPPTTAAPNSDRSIAVSSERFTLSFRDMYEEGGIERRGLQQEWVEDTTEATNDSHDILQEYFAKCSSEEEIMKRRDDATPPTSQSSRMLQPPGMLLIPPANNHSNNEGNGKLGAALLAPSPAPPQSPTVNPVVATAAAPSACIYEYSPSQDEEDQVTAEVHKQQGVQNKDQQRERPIQQKTTTTTTTTTNELMTVSEGATSTVASSVASTVGSMIVSPGNYSFQNQPMLYSAIGSLEDPSGNSFKTRYKNNQSKPSNEFRNQQRHLLPPPDHACPNKSSSSSAQTRKLSKGSNGAPPIPPASSKGGKTVPSASKEVSNIEKKDCEKEVPGHSTGEGSSGGDNIINPATKTVPAKEPPRWRQQQQQQQPNKASSLKKPASSLKKYKSPQDKVGSGGSAKKKAANKRVTIAEGSQKQRNKSKNKQPLAMFRPSSDAYTPRMGKKVIKYKPAEMRTPVQQMQSPLGTLQRPNFRDALRRVAMIMHQHVVKITRRFENKTAILEDDGLFTESMHQAFSEEQYATPTYKCTMVRVPMARPGMVYGLKRVRTKYTIPTEAEIYDFAHRLFKSVQLSSECSIVCLIYVERLMETAKVPVLADTWRPIFMCGLLLASKVWQDLSSWNIEFASVYPQYSLDAINRLELQFLRMVKWDLYISSSAYAKYYFALRSLVEKPDFRQRYNRMVGGVDSVQASEALKIEKRSSMVKEEALLQLSRSM